MGAFALAREQSDLFLGDVPVLANDPVAPGYYWMRLRAPAVARAARPGQFVHLRCGQGPVPLLRRPMSIARADPVSGTFEIIYKVSGIGTRLLASVPAGGKVDVLGPLGRPFRLMPGVERAVVAGRGIGAAPLIFWAEEAVARRIEVWAFLSGRTEATCFGADILATRGVHVTIGSDDGAGVGSDTLLRVFAETCREARIQHALTCGSRRMARLVRDLAEETGLVGDVSLEAQMGCGMGACHGCVVQVLDSSTPLGWRYALACQEGPVFDVREVWAL